MIIYFGLPTGGTDQTRLFCIEYQKPYLLIDAEIAPIQTASEQVKSFVSTYEVSVLNVAGPRASGGPGAYEYTFKVIDTVSLTI